jgi:hypothetical protein
MNVTTRETVRFWAPTAIVGLVSTAGVSMIMTAVVSAPAHSRPVPYEPPPTSINDSRDGDRVQSRPRTRQVTRNCFMGGFRAYPTADGTQQPQCTVAARIASFPRLSR